MSADTSKYHKSSNVLERVPFFKVVTAIGVASFCAYWYYKQPQRVLRAVSKHPHISDGTFMPVKRLNNGYDIPILGLGTWELGNVDGKGCDKTVIDNALNHAVHKAGYRLIDCASDYLNEHMIGDSLFKMMETKQVQRKDLFIVSKLNQNYHKKEHVKKQLMKTLYDLRLDYLDLFLVHWPFSFEYVDFDEKQRGFDEDYDSWTKLQMPGVSLQETWQELEALVDEGLVRSIGVCNFNVQLLYDLLSYARIKPAVNQIELHPYNQQSNLVRFCHFAGVEVIAYAPLGTPANKEESEDVLLDDKVLNEIGLSHSVSAAQVALKWNTQRDVIVVTKSNNVKRISENKALQHFELSQSEMNQLKGLERNLRYLRPEHWDTTKNIPIFD